MLARKLSRRPGLNCIRLSRVLASAVSSGRLRLARLARDRLRWDQAWSGGLSSRAYGGSWQTVNQSRAAMSSAMAWLMSVLRLSDDHQQAAARSARGLDRGV